ncbi:Outer membrane protein OmpA [Erythrobacter litoralis]|jgi:outer membrane protein OmpA-like peptidoglycan-associated protein|uniref:Membrane protein n=1 Tax=Erythrobacter litoralis TaxID=39960 RepID=A0A074MD54_9SPHN|nr:OmpA family protein [Erythrobacter litoralis]AOL22073.1 Outer membrane protein OmpA [Erythrobacter litoralis]KEO90670.1 membrane protein [Erythrobacter litoralis]MEE4339090.1 OmpA family protein [Erythrobacter sp.]
MKVSRILLSGTAALALIGTSGCVTDPNTGERKASRTAIGAGIGGTLGYLLGGAIGGDAARIIGAGIGGSAGAVIGKQYDDQIRELDELTEGTGVEVEEVGDQEAILLRMPDGVTFATGSAQINPGFYDTLNAVAQNLVNYPNSLIDVYGFTDTTGSDALNQRLSEQRAQAVADYLAARGVARSRLATQGYGEQYDYLRVKTADGVAEPLNRRVEIKIIPISQDDVNAARGN